jgi:FG-GAP-like repeat
MSVYRVAQLAFCFQIALLDCCGVAYGQFSPAPGSPFFFYSTLSQMAVGDFNNDGKLDLVVVREAAGQQLVFMGDGSGGFSPAAANPFVPEAFFVVVADFNRDGNLDLAFTSLLGTVWVFLGDGSGAFSLVPGGPIPIGDVGGVFAGQMSIAAGDFDRDGKVDLIVAHGNDTLATILLGNGQGGFTLAGTVDLKVFVSDLRLGDFNNDGKLDIAVNGPIDPFVTSAALLTILLGDGAGGFSPATRGPSTLAGGGAMALGDFNRDGNLDIAVGTTILLGNGLGSFSTVNSGAVASTPSVVAADFNHDGKLDLAFTNPASNTVSIMFGDGTGMFAAAPGSPFALPTVGYTGPGLIVGGDFNRDGRPDLAIADFFPGSITVMLNRYPNAPVHRRRVQGADETVPDVVPLR